MDEKVFDRIEKKFLITKEQEKAITSVLKQNMDKDVYFRSEVMNVYFDNDNYDLITHSIDWVGFKEKVRARSYVGYDRVFLEIKTKIHERDSNPGFKRRVMITKKDYDELVSGHTTMESLAKRSIETSNDLQIAREVDYLIEYLKLKPKILVSYERSSYKNDDGLRITFDKNLKYRTKNLSFIKGKRDKMYFKDKDIIIMEVKAHGFLPLWLTKTMTEQKIYPVQFSKIGKIYENIRKEKNV